MIDGFGRKIDYMRISITDRCNLRCKYCMPDGIELLPMSSMLTYEEIARICGYASGLGIRKIKLTGGEPLVRIGLAELVKMIKAVPGIEQVTMTTNGVLLAGSAEELKAAGLDAVNISLDTVDPDRFEAVTGFRALDKVLEGIDAAVGCGLKVKLNSVPQKESDLDEISGLMELAADKGIDIRFIEMMPIGFGKRYAGVSNTRIVKKIEELYGPLDKDTAVHGNGPAVYCRVPKLSVSVGFISAIDGKFCDTCNRIRLTSQGVIKPCLCYEGGTNLKPLLDEKDPEGEEARVTEALREAILGKPKAHHFENSDMITEKAEMAKIGG